MLLLSPRHVTFAGALWEDIAAVAIDRSAGRTVIEWSDLGPHVVLADVPEQQVTIRVVQRLARDEIGTPRPSDEGELVFHTSPAGADSPRKRIRAQCVVLEVVHELSIKNGALRTIRLVAISPDGATDPIMTDEG